MSSAAGSSQPITLPGADLTDAGMLLQQTERLRQINAWFEVALNNMARGLSMFDADQRLIVCNALYREIYNLPAELTRPGTPFRDIVAYHVENFPISNDTSARETHDEWIQRHVADLKRGKSFSHTQHLSDGRIILVTYQPLADGGWVDIQEDVTEKTRAAERESWLARHCPLTEVANRRYFRELLDDAIKTSDPKHLVAVHLIDLDRFKAVNDTHGHAAGDALLKAVAKRLRTTVRDGDIVGRLGGDEFAVIQRGIVSIDKAESLAQRLVRVLSAPYRVLGESTDIGASIGVALVPDHGDKAETLLRKADIALYGVKSKGRGDFHIYSRSYEKAALTQMNLERDVARAAAEKQLVLHYQPIVSLKSRTVVGFEALMRWNHPRQGLLSPATFVPVAERTGAIVEMGAWAIRQACKDALTWPGGEKVTVNLSPVQFERGNPAEIAREALADSGLAPDRLEFEITESVLLKGEERTLAILAELRALGVRVALDDFGTAFASLSYLRTFSFDKIKIDRSFVRDMTERRDCAAIVNAVAGLATALDIGAVAEGIETEAQLTGVNNAGCAEVQGYLFSPPVPAEQVANALSLCAEKLSRM